ncbi:hypothetical protein SAMN05216268_109222 [Streptomyces yunnanensis]|uniref:Uncharacterized protein n=1 Tax=Streptomyces yunnanensis TaxID=156453 RepID=A0A9X8QUM8_9ACTN|nr:hypothetical protein SAMN05216268_109222 [Streptomyces yunnanensis]
MPPVYGATSQSATPRYPNSAVRGRPGKTGARDAGDAVARNEGFHPHALAGMIIEVLEQYEPTGAVDTARFPTLDDFAARHIAHRHP